MHLSALAFLQALLSNHQWTHDGALLETKPKFKDFEILSQPQLWLRKHPDNMDSSYLNPALNDPARHLTEIPPPPLHNGLSLMEVPTASAIKEDDYKSEMT